MMNKLCFKVFDRTLRNILKFEDEENSKNLFVGKVVVMRVISCLL